MGIQRDIPAGSASVMITVAMRDATTSDFKTGIAYGSVTYSVWRDGAPSGVATGTCVNSTKGNYTDHGWIETDYAGLYQFGIPDAALLAGARGVKIKLVASGAIDVVIDIQLVGQDNSLPVNDPNGHFIVYAVSEAITLPEIPNNWITDQGIADDAFNGKGDWLTTLGTHAPQDWIDAGAIAKEALNGKGDWGTGQVTGYARGQDPASLVLTLANGIESGISLKQAIQIIGAAVAGKCTGDTFIGLDGSTVRITGTVVGNNRTVATYSV